MAGKYEKKNEGKNNSIICGIAVLMIAVILVIGITIGLSAQNKNPVETLSSVEQARNNVLGKWNTASGELGTAKYIEDIYKEYPQDSVIANVYYYCIAKEQYGHYESLNNSKYLEQAIEYAEKIDPNYSGELADEIHAFVKSIVPVAVSPEKYEAAKKKEDKYSSLTNSEKKKICEYIESRYEYYDNLNGGYAGDKYSDTIMEEAAKKYGLTVTQIEIIWMKMYSY